MRHGKQCCQIEHRLGHQFSVPVGKCLVGASSVGAWPIFMTIGISKGLVCDWYVIGVWLMVCDWCVIDGMWLVCDWCVIGMWHFRGWYVIGVRMACECYPLFVGVLHPGNSEWLVHDGCRSRVLCLMCEYLVFDWWVVYKCIKWLVATSLLGMVAESGECGPQMREVGSSVPSWFKPIMYQIRFPSLVLGINRIGQGLVSSVSG